MDTVDSANADIVPRAGYSKTLSEIQEGGFCPFCEENLAIHHDKPILATSSHWIVTENKLPYAGTRHHFLLISRRHTEKFADLASEEIVDFFNQCALLEREYNLTGMTLLWRSGSTLITGATVVHLHAHLIIGNERTDTSAPITALVGFSV
jgi:diadenosine tetraphosphate (Ap4A) HIT family hydrolase